MKHSPLRTACLLLALASLVACGGGSGVDGALFPNSPVPVVGKPWNLHVADFNGDGYPDIAAPGESAGVLNILMGTGGGAFQPSAESPLAMGAMPIGIAGGKINADGLEDLVVADFGAAQAYVVLATGPGQFSAAVAPPVATGNQPYASALVDLNGDGSLDFVVANEDDDTVTVLRGSPARDGTFTFWNLLILPAGSRPAALVMADFNQDGRDDFAIGSHLGDDVRILLGDGAGGGTYVGMFPLPTGSRIFDMKAGDLDSDGYPDLVTAYSGLNQAGVFLGNGDGTFTDGLPVSVADAEEVHGVALGDLNQDGKLDLVLSARTPGVVSARLGDGFGAFAGTAVGGDISVGPGARQVVLEDVNLDGRLDLLTAVYDLGVIDVRLGAGNGGFLAFVRPQ